MSLHGALRLGVLTLGVALGGCASESPDRAQCVRSALTQPALDNGAAVFTGDDGTARSVSATWRSRFRLALRHEYPVASLTKPLIAHAVARHIAAGDFGLDTPIADALDEIAFHPDTGRITIRQLLQHSGGLGRPDGLDPLWTRGPGTGTHPDCRAAAVYVAGLPPDASLTGRTFYSNAGYCLLGELLAQVAMDGPEDERIRALTTQPLGGAGAWIAPLEDVYDGLRATLPLTHLEPSAVPLEDGSWYGYGWRWQPVAGRGAPWMHAGRLPGVLSVALTDGDGRLVVAHFDGDPADALGAAARFGAAAWPCMHP